MLFCFCCYCTLLADGEKLTESSEDNLMVLKRIRDAFILHRDQAALAGLVSAILNMQIGARIMRKKSHILTHTHRHWEVICPAF